ncbi:nucleoside-diphosphate sugar epimerase/dehydratase [Comamonas testosteroni]|jgi:nucleoside-diphosphate-sugar epimerase|uniref:Polysaccharide biosynthesis protein CapD n=1 Tax=Comamonas testosteroni (strain DSM 14576 / KF-1) TaxID=399795 RepID=B7WT67_COMTK|nr:nucleoside-diphosphate sugar epimerase/dehydratase [Comamonas testosteroni]EED65435.1 polysaccharide biosynthesis protein CapD [Comamonas testosteroni KF-1]WQG68844.1 nucleoside-diphosphate sugar epimerase/dehydratase [Comamonas testosteroni]
MSLNALADHLLRLPRLFKQVVVLGVDVFMAVLAVWLAFYLRIDQVGAPVSDQGYVYGLAIVLFVPIFVRMGLYRAIFRYAGMPAVVATATSVLIYGIFFFAILLWMRWNGVPRSIGLIQPILFLLLAGGWRIVARYWLSEVNDSERDSTPKKHLLIYGAGEAGVQTASALDVMREFSVRGFVDDDPGKIGRTINGVPIIAPEDVAEFIGKHKISDILLAIPSLNRLRRREIIDQLQLLPAHVRSLPGMMDLASGKVTVADFQELDIEDLLGRDPVAPDRQLLAKNLAGKVVLVTGAGGSIGSELCRQIILERPQALVLVEHNEYGLYAIHHNLELLCKEHGLSVQLLPRLGSIRNLRRLRAIFADCKPHTVYHAAAYKHVPLVQENPAEGILNNVFGTLNVARVAMECGAERFVLISTDKAVRPTNVMGASKRMAELVLQAMAGASSVDFAPIDEESAGRPTENRTCFCMVRFGNVLGSSGSVVPLFRSQLRKGGPLTVTHAGVTRYFMTIPEAAQLVLQAGAMGNGGDVFVLDMGKPVRIIDLARRMIQLSGLTVKDESHASGDIEIQVVGLRPGEKLYEELLIGDNPETTEHTRIMKAHENFLPWNELLPHLLTLRRAAKLGDDSTIHAELLQLVSGYVAPGESEQARQGSAATRQLANC